MTGVSIDVGGVKETLPDEFAPYEDAFKTGAEAMRIALEIFDDPGFDEKTGWKADATSEDVTVHYKDLKEGRFYAGRVRLPLTAEVQMKSFWNELDKGSEWNDNIKFSNYVKKMTPTSDIAHYASNDVMVVKSREFLCARSFRQIGDAWILAARSTTLKEIPEQKAMIRAMLYLGAGRCRPDPADPSASLYDYVVCMDLKGMMFKSVLNQVMGKIILKDIENVKNHAQSRVGGH